LDHVLLVDLEFPVALVDLSLQKVLLDHVLLVDPVALVDLSLQKDLSLPLVLSLQLDPVALSLLFRLEVQVLQLIL
jgi:hypothetical protein